MHTTIVLLHTHTYTALCIKVKICMRVCTCVCVRGVEFAICLSCLSFVLLRVQLVWCIHPGHHLVWSALSAFVAPSLPPSSCNSCIALSPICCFQCNCYFIFSICAPVLVCVFMCSLPFYRSGHSIARGAQPHLQCTCKHLHKAHLIYVYICWPKCCSGFLPYSGILRDIMHKFEISDINFLGSEAFQTHLQFKGLYLKEIVNINTINDFEYFEIKNLKANMSQHPQSCLSMLISLGFIRSFSAKRIDHIDNQNLNQISTYKTS